MKNKKHAVFLLDAFKYSVLLVSSLLSLSVIFSFLISENSIEDIKAVSAEETALPTVIIDAGHGGVDSGAVSVYGDEEKHLNLSVAKKLGAFLESAGVSVRYTRTDDTMLDCEGSSASRKTRDLLGRVQVAKNSPDSLFVSIHMNTLPNEKYKGLQVFYSDRNDANRALAQVMQNAVAEKLQPDNKRSAKDAEGNIFILDRIDQAAILVECGFLTNREEAASLKDDAYQAKLAYVLSRPILDFLGSKKEN